MLVIREEGGDGDVADVLHASVHADARYVQHEKMMLGVVLILIVGMGTYLLLT